MNYYSLSKYLQETYHTKLYKIALNAHMSCPNRDGSLDHRGCIFCSEGGSGDFAVPVEEDFIEKGTALFGKKPVGSLFIGYFQAYTNTYAPLDYLEKVYRRVLEHPQIAGISIATRPDCIGEDVLLLLEKLRKEYPQKFLWIELGLQTIHEKTAAYIRRGYPLSVFDTCVQKLHQLELPVIVHLILGLPGESREDILASVQYLNRIKPFGVKLQLLHFLKGTDLGEEYLAGKVKELSKETYVTLLVDCLEQLRPDIVVHRLTGDGPKDLLLAPTWSLDKKGVLGAIQKEMKKRNSYQGKLWEKEIYD